MKLARLQLLHLVMLGLGALLVVHFEPVSKVSSLSNDFALSASPSSLILSQGVASSFIVTVTGQGGYQGNVSLSIAETFDSIHIKVQPTPSLVELKGTIQSANSTATISVSPYTLPGTYSLDVEGHDGISSHQIKIALTVTGQDIAISSSPSRLDFQAGQNKTLSTTVTVSSLGSFSGTVSLTASVSAGYPPVSQVPSASPSTQTVSITPSATASFQLAISVNSSMVAHPYNLEVTGTAATTVGVPRFTEIGVIIGPDFNMSMVTRNLVVHQGAMLVAPLTFSSINGFTGTIAAYSGLIAVNPPNPQIDLYPSAPLLAPGGTNTSRIVIKTDGRTGLGTYSIGIEASDLNCCVGGFLPYNLTVAGPLAGPDFAMYADPPYNAASLGSTANSSINLIGENGFSGPVTMFTPFPSIARLNPESATLSPTVNVTSTLTLTIPGPPPSGGGGPGWWFASGTYAVRVIAMDPTGLAHDAWVNTTVTPFSLVASPGRQELKANSTTTFDLTVNGIGGFNDTVVLGAKAPQAIMIGLSDKALNFSGAPSSLSSKVTVSVPAGTPDGDYVIQVTGTYMHPRYICSCAPKDALSYAVPVHVVVTSTPGSSTILGLQPAVFFSIVGATAAAVVITASYTVVLRRKRARANLA